LGNVLKWVVFGIFAAVVAFFVLRALLKHLANFTDWARRLLDSLRAWWEGLFGGGRSVAAEAEASVRPPVSRPFASFHNPFRDGRADRLSRDQLVRYSFDALQAWAAERGLERHPEETPREFTERLGEEIPALADDARGLAGLYALVAYTRRRLPADNPEPLRRLWHSLEDAGDRTLSA
jgi:hypothetical protein